MKLKFITDLHIFGPHEIDRTLISIDWDYAIGDIFDIKNTRKFELEKARAMEQRYAFRRVGRYYVVGNHDGIISPYTYITTVIEGKKILICHHYQYLDPKVANEMNAAKREYKGVTKLYWKLLGTFHKLVNYGNLSFQDKKDAAKWAKEFDCEVIIFGHTHTEKLVDELVDGIRVINLPRGYSEIEI